MHVLLLAHPITIRYLRSDLTLIAKFGHDVNRRWEILNSRISRLDLAQHGNKSMPTCTENLVFIQLEEQGECGRVDLGL